MKINVNNEHELNEKLHMANAKVRNADHQSVKAIVFQIEKNWKRKGFLRSFGQD